MNRTLLGPMAPALAGALLAALSLSAFAAAEPSSVRLDDEIRHRGLLWPGVVGSGAVGTPAGATSPAGARATTSIRVAPVGGVLGGPLPQALYFGASWVDLDGDGDLDLTVPADDDERGRLAVWRNDGALGFVDITAALGLDGVRQARSAGWVDLDGDGDLDLFLTRRSSAGTNLVLEPVGSALVPRSVAALEEPASEGSQAWADFDGDGDLDLFLPGSILAPPRLLRNDGAWSFVDVGGAVGLDLTHEAVTGAWADFDDDGDPDLAVGGLFELRLYRNDDGALVEIGDALGLGGGLLVLPSWADVDGDGALDLHVGGLFPPVLLQNRVATGGGFVDMTEAWGSGFALGNGVTWADLDLDGDLDMLDEAGNNGPKIYENRIRDGTGFVDVSEAAGLAGQTGLSWHPVPGDFDGDGLVDFFEPHEQFARLFRNLSEPVGRALRLRLVAAGGALPVGARVTLSLEDRLQVREIGWPMAHFAFAAPEVVLALADRPTAPWVEVRWASGLVERFGGLSVRRTHTLVEGRGRAVSRGKALGHEPVAAASSAELRASCNPCRSAVTLSSAPGPLEVIDLRGRVVRRLPASAGSVSWDLRDGGGARVTPGVYWVRGAAGAAGARPLKLVILP